jgi:hypothetical protein
MDHYPLHHSMKYFIEKLCIMVLRISMLSNSVDRSGKNTRQVRTLCRFMNVGVFPIPSSYDAHPMAILTSAFAYLGSYYSEANPSLQGDLMI